MIVKLNIPKRYQQSIIELNIILVQRMGLFMRVDGSNSADLADMRRGDNVSNNDTIPNLKALRETCSLFAHVDTLLGGPNTITRLDRKFKPRARLSSLR